MRDAVKVLAAIVCVASASGIDLIDGFLKGFSIGNRGEDDDDDDFKGKARSDRSFLSDLENAHGACELHCLFVHPSKMRSISATGDFQFQDGFGDNFSTSFASLYLVSEALFGDDSPTPDIASFCPRARKASQSKAKR